MSLWKVFILAFLGSVPSRCISPPDEFGFCLFEINPYNSVAYFQMILAAIAILMTVVFITYLPQYDISKDRIQKSLASSMLVIDVGDSSCWWSQVETPNISWTSPTWWFCNQHLQMVIMIKSPTSLKPKSHYLKQAKPTDMLVTPVATEKKLLQQIKPVGLINATTVTCCTCTMALYCIQSTLEVVLI